MDCPPNSQMHPQAPRAWLGGSGGPGWATVFCLLLAGSLWAAEKQEPLALKLPPPTLKGTPPDNPPKGEHIEPLDLNKTRPPFLAPAGAQNLALNKKVTASDPKPINGEALLVTDGSKDPNDDDVLELHKGVQWIQVDLEAPGRLSAIVLWLDHRYYQIIHNVVVQIADDAGFTKNVRTLFNNDRDNSTKLGAGKDKEYWETCQGKLIDAKGESARYLRVTTRGGSESGLNCYTEIEAWGLPAK
jgi:hypothetical protein